MTTVSASSLKPEDCLPETILPCRIQQAGQSLPLVLVAIGVGALLIAALLTAVDGRLSVSRSLANRTQQWYATDAGIEYAIHRLAYDPSFHSGLYEPGATVTITTPGLINGLRPTVMVRTISLTDTWGGGPLYLLWGDSITCTDTIDIAAGGSRLTGNVHTNKDLTASGGTSYITGTVTYVDTAPMPPDIIYNPPPPDNPKKVNVQTLPEYYRYNIADYRPGGRAAVIAAARGEYYTGTTGFYFTESTIPSGLYYTTGDIKITGSNVTGTVTLVAEGTIEWSGHNGTLQAYMDNLVLFSAAAGGCNKDVISGAGSEHTIIGNVSGLGGLVDITAADNTFGTIIGLSIKTRSTGGTGMLMGEAKPCSLYDIRGTTGQVTISARVRLCGSRIYILSWMGP